MSNPTHYEMGILVLQKREVSVLPLWRYLSLREKPVSQSRQQIKKLYSGNEPTSTRGIGRIIFCRSVKYLLKGVNNLLSEKLQERKLKEDTNFSSTPFTPKLKHFYKLFT